jgi:hypothetical protein
LIYMSCYMSSSSYVILLFLYNNRLIYTLCYMSCPSSGILQVRCKPHVRCKPRFNLKCVTIPPTCVYNPTHLLVRLAC